LAEEKSLTVYSGRSQEFISPFLEEFTKETGISVELRFGDSAALAAQILEEGNNSPADVFLSQDAGSLGAVNSAGLVVALDADLLSRVPVEFQAKDGGWVGITGRARVMVYSPGRVSTLPKTVDDLTAPEWKGRLGIAPTNASFQAFVTAMIQARGEESTENWLRAIKANKPALLEKNSQIVEAVDAGSIDLGLVNHYYIWEVEEELKRVINAKIEFFQPGDLGNLINASGGAILKSSKNQDSARKLLEFLISDAIQEKFVMDTHEYSLVNSALKPGGVPALKDIKAPSVDLSSLSGLEQTQALLIKVGLI
jgi:iron(III) transport system substrate-binding protein